jgi:two-component sensor histidine kinase
MAWVDFYIETDAAKEACRSWFALVLSDDSRGPVRAAIQETDGGGERELRAVFVEDGKEREYRRRRQKGVRFIITIREPAPWPVK